MGLVLEQVDDVQHHVDVRAGLALTRQRRAVDNFEAGQVEGWPETLVSLRIEVATTYQQASPGPCGGVVGELQRTYDPIHPLEGLTGKPISDGLIELPQARVNIIEIYKKGAFQDALSLVGAWNRHEKRLQALSHLP
jgi:hypothetical protein